MHKGEKQMRWALVNSDNIVENVVIWDGVNDLFHNTTNINLNENERCEIGFLYDPNGDPRFNEPPIEELNP